MTHEIDDEVNQISEHHKENIDPKEIAKFDAVAANWWDLEGWFKPLHRINPLRLDYILERSGGLFDKDVLDVGCGGGILSESMAREGAKVTGLDICAMSLAVARLHALKNSVTLAYHQQTVEEYAEMHFGSYDVVTCMEILEHVPDPASIVRSCAHLVRPDGEVFFSTINRNSKAWMIAIVGAEYVLRMVPRGTHNITKFIKPAELLGWVDDTYLCEQHIIGIHYSLLLDRFYLGSNIDVNYILHTRRQS